MRSNTPPRADHPSGCTSDFPLLLDLLHALDATPRNGLPPSVVESLVGLHGLLSLATAVTILLIDYGGTEPWSTTDEIDEVAPDLVEEFGKDFVATICGQIQGSHVPEESATYQQMFNAFNERYFDGRLPDYEIIVVYDILPWEERCGHPIVFPQALHTIGFIDFASRMIFIRYRPHGSGVCTMPAVLVHEMAHAATNGDHGENWRAEMARLKSLGAPVDDADLVEESHLDRR